MSLVLEKPNLSNGKVFLIGLPTELGCIFIGLILSSYHWTLFFIPPIVGAAMFYFAFKYLYAIEFSTKGSVKPLFYGKVILIQVVFITCILLLILP